MISSPIAATVTPFRPDGAVDLSALGDYLGLLHDAGVTSLLVNGTTGEFASLTVRERRQLVEFCRSRWRGTLIAHVGACALDDALDLTEHANDLADCLAAIAPYFFAHAPEAGLENFFAQVLGRAQKPVLLYNFPRHTQVNLSPGMVARLAADFPALFGVKDSGKDLTASRAYKAASARIQVFLGDDRVGPRVRELGVDGVVTGAGGPVAELPVRIAAAVAARDIEAAAHLQRVFDRYTEARKTLPLSDIAFAKAALQTRLPGFPARVRPPLTAAEPAQWRLIMTAMHNTLTEMRPLG
ncbi:dihydrodipicolinate synthase family protein [Nocardia transvalensis]|uniref:dihydrodipicolinate synthase family protein n=1 Tax=Nocardia transvalensis TaxID=37333 RepID=UPI00189621A2|nr:dihydrodipicolinate synthase family protein [Nocardia transvalensis]MBF6331868.1 dihydrodipicolinate synthase family protein [Nocardia transvalensis]